MNRVKLLLKLANAFRRALDYEKDPNPEHWKTINGAKVHVDKNGKYDGGAGGKFNGDYHFGGADWKDKKARIESLANIFNQAVAQKQAQANAQGNEQGNTSAKNVAPKATQGGANGVIIETQKEIEEWKKKKDELQALQDKKKKKYKECRKLEIALQKKWNPSQEELDAYNKKLHEYQDAIDLFESSKPALIAEIEQHRISLAAKEVPFTSNEWKSIETAIFNSSVTVKELPPKKLKAPLSSDEIGQKLAGGDKTSGSCASVALAYVANKNGLDVLDFRGGASMRVFRCVGVIEKIARLPGVKSQIIQSVTPKEVSDRLENLTIGKEYYLATGLHASIVRRTGKGVEYLELQDPQQSGWTSFGGSSVEIVKELDKRFKKNSQRKWGGMILMDVESFKNCAELEKLVGYINTKSNEQKKGATGYVK